MPRVACNQCQPKTLTASGQCHPFTYLRHRPPPPISAYVTPPPPPPNTADPGLSASRAGTTGAPSVEPPSTDKAEPGAPPSADKVKLCPSPSMDKVELCPPRRSRKIRFFAHFSGRVPYFCHCNMRGGAAGTAGLRTNCVEESNRRFRCWERGFKKIGYRVFDPKKASCNLFSRARLGNSWARLG